MTSFLQQVFSLLTTVPGVLAYNLVVAFSIVAAWLALFSQWRSGGDATKKRMAFGLSLLLGLRISLFLVAGLTWQGLLTSAALLPATEWVVDLLSLLVIVWMWVYPRPFLPADLAALFLGVLILLGAVLAIAWGFRQEVSPAAGGSLFEKLAQWTALVLLLLGVILLALQRPAAWFTGLVMLGLLALGYLVEALLPAGASDYSGAVRLSQMIAYPLLIVLPSRYSAIAKENNAASRSSVPVQDASSTGEVRPGRYAPEYQALFFDLLEHWQPEHMAPRIAESLARSSQADFCLFGQPEPGGSGLAVAGGYDLVHRQPIPARRLSAEEFPVLLLAVQQCREMQLPGNSTIPDLRRLASTLDLTRCGPLILAPVPPSTASVPGFVLAFSPFNSRSWQPEDVTQLTEIAAPLVRLWQHSAREADLIHSLVQKENGSDTEEMSQPNGELAAKLHPSENDAEWQPEINLQTDATGGSAREGA